MKTNWVCDCDVHASGKHIADARYVRCAACGAKQNTPRDIVVPTGEGGEFSVFILEIESGGCLVKNSGNAAAYDRMPPYFVAFADIYPAHA